MGKNDKIYTVITLFIMGILSFLYGGELGNLLIRDGGFFFSILNFLTSIIGIALGFIFGSIFFILGTIALFLDVKSYPIFIISVLVGVGLILLPVPLPIEDIIGIIIMVAGIINSTQPEKKQITTKLGI